MYKKHDFKNWTESVNPTSLIAWSDLVNWIGKWLNRNSTVKPMVWSVNQIGFLPIARFNFLFFIFQCHRLSPARPLRPHWNPPSHIGTPRSRKASIFLLVGTPPTQPLEPLPALEKPTPLPSSQRPIGTPH